VFIEEKTWSFILGTVDDLILPTYGFIGKDIDVEHWKCVRTLDRRSIRLHELRLRMMIRDGRKDSGVVSLGGICMGLWTVDGMEVRLQLRDRGQEVRLSAWCADMDTFRLFRCDRRIVVVVETLRIADRRA
jgi:hypothetical protein